MKWKIKNSHCIFSHVFFYFDLNKKCAFYLMEFIKWYFVWSRDYIFRFKVACDVPKGPCQMKIHTKIFKWLAFNLAVPTDTNFVYQLPLKNWPKKHVDIFHLKWLFFNVRFHVCCAQFPYAWFAREKKPTTSSTAIRCAGNGFDKTFEKQNSTRNDTWLFAQAM